MGKAVRERGLSKICIFARRNLRPRAEWHLSRSIAYSALGKTEEARKALNQLDKVTEELTDDWKMGNNAASNIISIGRTMAEGELSYREGNSDRAFELLRKAVQMEEGLTYDEPPGWMQPVRHALGALLMADGRHEEAEAVYRTDLVRHPNNAWSLLGLQQSLQKQDKIEEASAMAPAVRRAWANSDVSPVASCYCHPDARGK